MAMTIRKFLAFDIETASISSESLNSSSPLNLGICCWAVSSFAPSLGKVRSQTGHGWIREEDCRPSPRMNQDECRDLVGKLMTAKERGFTLVTHNGIGFDFRVLAEESEMFYECSILARESIDMMFHFLCVSGFPVGLAAIAKGMGIPGKTEGMSGGLVPEMWGRGEWAKVLEYVKQDTVLTLQVAMRVEEEGRLIWVTGKGKRRELWIEKWKNMEEALRLPLPYVGWMDNPLNRMDLVDWVSER